MTQLSPDFGKDFAGDYRASDASDASREAIAAPLADATREELATNLAMRAQAGERRNRPRVLVIASVLLFVVASVFALHATGKASDAQQRTQRAKAQADNTLAALAQLDSLIKRRAGEGPRIEGSSQALSKIEAAGVRAGYAGFPVGSVTTTARRDIGANQIAIRYSGLKHEDLGVLLTWMNSAVSDVPGLEVASVTLKPEAEKWSMDVRFTRWEKIDR
jgi:hypothetical protein